jgi:hypothetical protein
MPLPPLRWGLADAVPPEATAAWGCRAIVTQDGSVDLVADRIDRQGDTVIYDRLDEEFPKPRLIETLGDLLRSGLMSTRARRTFVIHQSDTLVIVADTLGSAGYCHVAAWTTVRPAGGPGRGTDPPLQVRAFHNVATDQAGRNLGFFGFKPGHPVVEVFRDVVPASSGHEAICEQVFTLLNVGDDPSFGAPDPRAVAYRARNNRSPVGDCLSVGDAFYAVTDTGFQPIDPPRIVTVTRPGTTPLHD